MCGIWALFGCNSAEDLAKMVPGLFRIRHRGPDAFSMLSIGRLDNSVIGFVRLSIVDPVHGMQPLKSRQHPNLFMVFNGEIYNWKELRDKFGFKFETHCDTEVILHLYAKGGIEFCVKQLYGVFAFVLADVENNKVYYARDTFGVRPMFVLEHELQSSTALKLSGACSEVKGLLNMQKYAEKGTFSIKPHPPGHFTEFNLLENGSLQLIERKQFHVIGAAPSYDVSVTPGHSSMYEDVRSTLSNAVDVRLMADRKIGCMLSGGLDSSLVTALVKQHMPKWGFTYPLQTFAIGMDINSPDLRAARLVADYLGTDHHEVVCGPDEFLDAVESVVVAIESYDITTVRASVGMYLVAKYINENTDCKIIFSGEGADELCQGYIYFHKAPSPQAGDVESRRLLSDLYMYDVLRADRTTAAHGLELRVPMLDHYFVHTILNLPPEERAVKNNIEKYTLRKAFDEAGLIPNEILWRPKEAFSDGVSTVQKSWFSILQDHIELIISNEELANAKEKYPHNTPLTKEALHYRNIFTASYPQLDELIPYIWMPRWSDAKDPSARVLTQYQSSFASKTPGDT